MVFIQLKHWELGRQGGRDVEEMCLLPLGEQSRDEFLQVGLNT